VDAARHSGVSHQVEFIDQCVRQAALYPRWLVIASTVITLAVILWIVVKLLKWSLLLLFTLIVLTIVGGAVLWCLG